MEVSNKCKFHLNIFKIMLPSLKQHWGIGFIDMRKLHLSLNSCSPYRSLTKAANKIKRMSS